MFEYEITGPGSPEWTRQWQARKSEFARLHDRMDAKLDRLGLDMGRSVRNTVALRRAADAHCQRDGRMTSLAA